jgi:hypothetical protein
MIRYTLVGIAGALLLVGASPTDAGAQDVSQPTYQAVDASLNHPGWIVPYAGVAAGPGSMFGYGGVVLAPNANLTKSGIVARGFYGAGSFSYDNAAVAGGEVDGTIRMFDTLAGYQVYGPKVRVGGYVGVEHQDIQLTPNDPTATVNGKSTGVKVLGEFETRDNVRVYFNTSASYSKAFDTYRVQIRPGLRLPLSLRAGPEVVFQGNKGGDARRVGLFLMLDSSIGHGNYFGLTGSGGYAYAADGAEGNFAGQGAYGGLLASFFF